MVYCINEGLWELIQLLLQFASPHPHPLPPIPEKTGIGCWNWHQNLLEYFLKKDLKTSQALGAGNADIITMCCMHALLLFVWFGFGFHTANCMRLYYCWSDTAKAWSSKLSCWRGHWWIIIPGNMAVFLSGKDQHQKANLCSSCWTASGPGGGGGGGGSSMPTTTETPLLTDFVLGIWWTFSLLVP